MSLSFIADDDRDDVCDGDDVDDDRVLLFMLLLLCVWCDQRDRGHTYERQKRIVINTIDRFTITVRKPKVDVLQICIV